LFASDALHLNANGYALWKREISAYLRTTATTTAARQH
jgi:lysophospholipase L1-like esterase